LPRIIARLVATHFMTRDRPFQVLANSFFRFRFFRFRLLNPAMSLDKVTVSVET
jgi:hypothetical protein